MSVKKILFLCLCVSQFGCSTPARMGVDDLSNYKIDCNRRNEQYTFLESQRYSDTDRLNLALQMTSIIGVVSNVVKGTADDSSAGMRSEHEAMIKAQQRELRQRCLIEDYFKKSQ